MQLCISMLGASVNAKAYHAHAALVWMRCASRHGLAGAEAAPCAPAHWKLCAPLLLSFRAALGQGLCSLPGSPPASCQLRQHAACLRRSAYRREIQSRKMGQACTVLRDVASSACAGNRLRLFAQSSLSHCARQPKAEEYMQPVTYQLCAELPRPCRRATDHQQPAAPLPKPHSAPAGRSAPHA